MEENGIENVTKDRSKPMMIIIIVLMVVMLGAIAAIALFTVSKLDALSVNDNNSDKGEQHITKELSAEDIREFSIEDPLTNNLLTSENGEEHVVVLRLALGIDNTDTKKADETETMLEEREGIIRDIANTVIRDTTYEELKADGGVAALKQRILARLQEEFQTNMIVAIYTSEIRYS